MMQQKVAQKIAETAVAVEPSPEKMANVTVPVLTPPNDIYKKLLPAVLFLMTFVSVMTMLLIFMDYNTPDGQRFRMNMVHDYELPRISQESAALVAYVRQLHLAPRATHAQPVALEPTRSTKEIDELLGTIYNGTFVEWIPHGARHPSTAYLESARGWEGAVVRAATRDYLTLRAAARALHACLSPSPHPREVTYYESDGQQTFPFSSRVLCLPLYTVLLAADAAHAHYVLLGGDAVLPALASLPFDKVQLKIIEYLSTDTVVRNNITQLLETKNYTVAADYNDSIMYILKQTDV